MRIIEWDNFIKKSLNSANLQPLAVTIGVFDGVHRGHQALIGRIRASPYLPTVVTFRQNPLNILKPQSHSGDIFSLEQKLRTFELLGVQQTVLIDFSLNFSTISGKDFINLLNREGQVKLLALGRNFRCGYRLDTGVEEIQAYAARFSIETWIAEPVMEGAERISSSRIRQAIAAGRFDEAALLLGRPWEPESGFA